jgi:hypothetical protein
MSFGEALGNIVRLFVTRALTYVLLLAGVCLIIANRNDNARHARLYQGIGIVLLGLALGSLGVGLASVRRPAQ